MWWTRASLPTVITGSYCKAAPKKEDTLRPFAESPSAGAQGRYVCYALLNGRWFLPRDGEGRLLWARDTKGQELLVGFGTNAESTRTHRETSHPFSSDRCT